MPRILTPSQIVSEAGASVASIADPRMRELAFEKLLDLAVASQPVPTESLSRVIQVLSVVVGVCISVLSFNASRQSEAAARKLEAQAALLDAERFKAERADTEFARRSAAAKPYIELRQKYYLEAVQVAAVLATPESHTQEELKEAKKRFRELYVAELSLVEGTGVETGMMALAAEIDSELTQLTSQQKAAYKLSHALRDSLIESWNLQIDKGDKPK